MATEQSSYHRGVAEEKRKAIVDAATELFLESGYDRTSLSKIAEVSGVSKATLFKQFPTKAALFEAIVHASWSVDRGDVEFPESADLADGLTNIGTRYAAVLARPEMVSLFRIVIAELPRFPELGRAQFDLGKLPYFDSVKRYLELERDAEHLVFDDGDLVTTQFLGMISNYVFWPRLLLGDWDPSDASTAHAVGEAVATMLARYASPTEG